MKNKLIHIFFKSDKFFLLPILASSLIFILVTAIFSIYFPKLPPKLPLFYSLPWGEGQLASKEQFFLLPIFLILITLINSFIASQLHPLQFVLKRMLMLSLVLINLIILVTTFKILLIFI